MLQFAMPESQRLTETFATESLRERSCHSTQEFLGLTSVAQRGEFLR